MKKILIVDDSAFTRGIHKQILEGEGHETIEAASGTEALEMYEKEKPDLVIMDLLMPDIDGLDVVKEIIQRDPDAKTIICSTDKQNTRMAEAKKVGTLGFITKPIDASKMVEMLKKVL